MLVSKLTEYCRDILSIVNLNEKTITYSARNDVALDFLLVSCIGIIVLYANSMGNVKDKRRTKIG